MMTNKALDYLKKKYDEIYDILIKLDNFYLIYDKQEKEYFYILDNKVTKAQLLYAKELFYNLIHQIIITTINNYDFTAFDINNFIDNNNKMMCDKNLIKLYLKFEFMLPSFIECR